jgi:hypothetical protein
VSELASVTDIRTRQRKHPAWKPETRKHAWEVIDEDGHHHKCVHCWVRYHSESDGAGFVKVWSHGPRRGRASKSLGPCPGPSGRPALAVVDSAPTLEVTADRGKLPGKAAAQASCCRCVPPLEPCGQPTRLYLGGRLCDWQAGLLGGAA